MTGRGPVRSNGGGSSSCRHLRARAAPAESRDGGWRAVRPARLPADSFPGSFEVLHLLAELFHRELQSQPDASQLDVAGFGAECVGFAVQFLAQEIELAPNRIAAPKQLGCLRDVGAQAIQFLADV